MTISVWDLPVAKKPSTTELLAPSALGGTLATFVEGVHEDMTDLYFHPMIWRGPVAITARVRDLHFRREAGADTSGPVLLVIAPKWDLPGPIARDDSPGSLRMKVLEAVDSVMDKLHLSESGTAELVGVSRNSIRNWRAGQSAYPATVKRLLQLANLVRALETKLGPEQLTTWLNTESEGGVVRRDLLATDEGMSLVARESSDILFAPPLSRVPHPEKLSIEGAEEPADAVYSPPVYGVRSRRRRPVPGD